MLVQNTVDEFLAWCGQRGSTLSEKSAQVAEIIRLVREQGDAALMNLTTKFDAISLKSIRVSEADIRTLASGVNVDSFLQAAPNIRRFHQREKPVDWRINSGKNSRLGKSWKPLRRVGIYIPGGQAAYPSSVLMNIIPAQIAGVPEIAVCTPPDKSGKINPQVAALCQALGVSEVYALGGAQAIAALAYGTESIAAVDKITGPGNAWVAEAKRQVFGKVGIDSVAGPSECLVIADEHTNASFAAIDLLAQAEHDSEAQVVLVAASVDVKEQIGAELQRLVKAQPRREIILQSMKSSRSVVVNSRQQMVQCANAYAPEHLQIMTADAEQIAGQISTAGTVFIGNATPTALGDYFCGTNHVLPTSGTARYASGLSVYDFMRQQNIVHYSAQDTAAAADTVGEMATSEGLFAHAAAMRMRIETPVEQREEDESRWFRPEVVNSKAYSSSMSAGKTEAARNELFLNYDEALQEKITTAISGIYFNRYPDASYQIVRGLLAKQLDTRPEMILPGSGSNELNLAVINAVIGPGNSLLTVSPSYFSYLRTAEMNGGRGISIPLKGEFSYPEEALLQAVTEEQPELIVLARPNNPTGTVITVEAVSRLCDRSSGLVLIDEAYVEFAEDSVLPLLREYSNLIITRTFSKARGSAGIRFGYAIADPSIIQQLQKVVLPYNLSSLTAAVAEQALESDWPGRQIIDDICAERKRIRSAIEGLVNVSTFDSGANFLLIKTRLTHSVMKNMFETQGIQVRFFENDERLAHCFRYSIQDRESNNRFVKTLELISEASGEKG